MVDRPLIGMPAISGAASCRTSTVGTKVTIAGLSARCGIADSQRLSTMTPRASVTARGRSRAPAEPPSPMLVIFRPHLPNVGLVQPRLTSVPPEGEAWVHELKFDGYRILAHVEGARVRLVTRNGNDWTDCAPGIVEAFAKLDARATLVDGEAVLLHPDGRPNFYGLRARLPRARAYAIAYVAFDLLFLDGDDLRCRDLLERRRALRQLVRPTRAVPHLSVSEEFEGSGAAVYEAACRLGAEGIVSKLRHSRYRAGRHGDWLKVLNPAYQRRGEGGSPHLGRS